MNFYDIAQTRRSIRKFTDEEIDPEDLKKILRAALMSPTSKSSRSWHFIVVDEREKLAQIAHCKSAGAEFVENAPVAVIVLADTEKTDVWVEDASIAAVTMQYQATELGLGSCWAQIRNRGVDDGTSADEVLREIFLYPPHLQALCVIAIGHPAMERKPQNEDSLKWENVHINTF